MDWKFYIHIHIYSLIHTYTYAIKSAGFSLCFIREMLNQLRRSINIQKPGSVNKHLALRNIEQH